MEEEVQKYDIENIKEVVVLGIEIFSTIKTAKDNDGKIDFNDLALLFPLFPKITAAVDQIGEVVPEFKDLDGEEAAELVALVAAGLDGKVDEKLQLQIEKSLLAVKAVYEAIQAFA